jgi:RNA polymerase sigma-70 factor, ECF subfamily
MDQRLSAIEAEIPRLRRYARYLTRDSDRADDLVQECLARAIAKVDSWQPGTNMRAWLFVILRNAHISEVRRHNRGPALDVVEDDHPGLAVGGGYDVRLEMLELRVAFDELTTEHREVLHLIVIEGLKYEEAAEILGVPVGTVRSRLSRARLTLRNRLEVSPPDVRQDAS